jgi:peptidoglycan/xylan/chitin deacetylase (PgdA/CDA1 family)
MNSDVKLSIIDSLFIGADYFRLFDTYSFFRRNVKPQLTIIMYHRVDTSKENWSVDAIDTSIFEKQIKYLKKTHKIYSLENFAQDLLEKKNLPKRVAVITFDDGYKDNYTNAFPILKKYKIPATIFLTTGHIETDKLFWWDKLGYILLNLKQKKINLNDFGVIKPSLLKKRRDAFNEIMAKIGATPEEKKQELIKELENIFNQDLLKEIGKNKTLTWDEVKEMSENNIDFGAHTVNHPILTKISLKQAEFEISQSKKDIEKRLNKPIKTFSYPNGLASDYNTEIIDILKKYGFTYAVTRTPNTINSKTSLFELGRVSPGWNYVSFKFCVSGIFTDFSNAFNWGMNESNY